MSYTSFAILLLLVAYGVLVLRLYVRERAPRIVHCPATGDTVAIKLAAARAAFHLRRRSGRHVTGCSLWPERRSCAQGCLAEIEDAPASCAFQRILADWYRGRRCAFCEREVPDIRWGDLRPSLLSPAGRLVMWSEIPPRELYDVLRTHRAVCASCDIAEAFRQRHADWVVERRPPEREPAHPRP